jgi:hypothetical protein
MEYVANNTVSLVERFFYIELLFESQHDIEAYMFPSENNKVVIIKSCYHKLASESKNPVEE